MDAPNAPNPANTNTQDQFVDAVQSPINQAQAHFMGLKNIYELEGVID